MNPPASQPTQCVLYFNRGTSCYIRLFVSIFSLRKHYSGAIKLMQQGELHPEITAVLGQLNVQVRFIPETQDKVLVTKASLWRHMEDDYAMYLDADSIVNGPVDEFLNWTREWGFVATWFTGWLTTGAQMQRRIREWSTVAPQLVPSALAYGKAINSGIQGWSKGASILPAYEDLTRSGVTAGCNGLIVDEIALQLLLPQHRHYLADHAWNTSGAFGETKRARVVHYHGRKHCTANPRCDLWKEHYFELKASLPEHAETLSKCWGDKRLDRFLAGLSHRRKNMTVVTAVNPAYADRLNRNLKAWLRLPGLKDQRFIVFVHGFKSATQRKFLSHPNIKVIRWTYPHSSATMRETMLAAFLLGVAKHVRTQYWMKLDADSRPRKPWWEWPDYEGSAVVSHRWGYTKMKGDAVAKEHWFNRLDRVFAAATPYFKQTFDPLKSRVSHRRGNVDGLPMRFASFCHIEKTAFTQRMAKHLVAHSNGRMVIPSQDTTSWYCATIWNEKIQLTNMKRWFKP